MDGASLTRLGLVVHPRRGLNKALDRLRRWSDEHGVDVVQVPAAGQDRSVAEPGHPAGQISAEVRVDGELFIRFAGDGLVAATPLGSSAYTLAAGGPLLAPGGSGVVLTPLSPHGGCCPPLVAAGTSRLEIALDPGHGGARIELDGQIHDRVEPHAPRTLTVSLRERHAMLVAPEGRSRCWPGCAGGG